MIALLGAFDSLTRAALRRGLYDLLAEDLRQALRRAHRAGHVVTGGPSVHQTRVYGRVATYALTPAGRALWRQLVDARHAAREVQRRGAARRVA